MTPESSVVEVTLESDLKNVEVAEEITRRVAVTAGFDEDEQHRIEMAVHESMINAIWHGNKNDSSKTVWLQFQIHRDRLEIRIRDQGIGFNPNSIPDPLESDNLLNVSGRGIFLIRAFMDEFRVENTSGAGTEVTMVKRLSSGIQTKQGGTDREHESHNSTS
ncbi:MAG: ATP-binding protein [Acidobacteriota bacterium]|jgi:serine/threonine-protein kinase RsbW|nr:ATP-binding protein [Acidobacteriota bacterium]